MKETIARKPPADAPEGTVWFGGPVDRFTVTLRIYGEELDPDYVSALLRCAPTEAERKGAPISHPGGSTRIPKRGRWSLTISSNECRENDDVEDAVKILFARLPSDPVVWASLTSTYAVDVFCGLFLASANRGFSISPEVSRILSARQVGIGFDVYFEQSK
jgi:hypothetical protein